MRLYIACRGSVGFHSEGIQKGQEGKHKRLEGIEESPEGIQKQREGIEERPVETEK